MNKERLDKMIARIQAFIDNFYANTEWDGEVIPTFFLFSPGNDEPTTIACIPQLPRNGDEKVALAAHVGEEAKKRGEDGYVFACESWTIPPDAVRQPGEIFANRPDRIESVIIEARLDTQEAALLMGEITREEGQHPKAKWKEIGYDDGTGKSPIESRFNIFRPREIGDPEFPDNSQFCKEQLLREILGRLRK